MDRLGRDFRGWLNRRATSGADRLGARLPFWRGQPIAWIAATTVLAALVAAPIGALVLIAARGSGDLWPHLFAYVLPVALRDTALLLAGVGVLVTAIGAGLAWLVTAYEFPGRRALDWALLLPLAMPTYIIAYAYLDLLHPIGPIQTTLRALLGLSDPRALWLPDVRSLGGCIALFAFVLYPYVFVATRAMFLMQAGSLLEASRMLGASRLRVLFAVALPLARPAIVIGTSLALMEALNDIGAAEFLGVQTLTVSIYATWINRSNLPGAAQIAMVLLVVIVVLILLERWARRHQRYATVGHRPHPARPVTLKGGAAALALGVGLLPVLFGFLLPALHLVNEATKRLSFAGVSPEIGREIVNTVLVSSIATAVALVLGLVIAYTARMTRGPLGAALVRASSLGYAIPGTVLAIGLVTTLAAIDNAAGDALHALFGLSTGLILSGSIIAIIYAYVARFLAISTGGIEAGLGKLSPSLDFAARSLGETAGGAMRRVHLPLIRPALGAAALLVFVDSMKELPATLLLRPLSFETLATHLYGEAVRGTYEDGAVIALCIVTFALAPVIAVARLSRQAFISPVLAMDRPERADDDLASTREPPL
jgi:iron(III) transport system permease protein